MYRCMYSFVLKIEEAFFVTSPTRRREEEEEEVQNWTANL